jgi:hypothetical protein
MTISAAGFMFPEQWTRSRSRSVVLASPSSVIGCATGTVSGTMQGSGAMPCLRAALEMRLTVKHLMIPNLPDVVMSSTR